MAPEQAKGEETIDIRADIYSLGATLYHLIAGAPPFEGATLAAVVAKHLSDPPAPLQKKVPSVTNAFAALLHDQLAKEPAERPETPAKLLERLRALPPIKAGGATSVRRFKVEAEDTTPPEAGDSSAAGATVLSGSRPAASLPRKTPKPDPTPSPSLPLPRVRVFADTPKAGGAKASEACPHPKILVQVDESTPPILPDLPLPPMPEGKRPSKAERIPTLPGPRPGMAAAEGSSRSGLRLSDIALIVFFVGFFAVAIYNYFKDVSTVRVPGVRATSRPAAPAPTKAKGAESPATRGPKRPR